MAESEAVKITQQDVINNVKIRQNEINAEKASKRPDQAKIDQLTKNLVQYSLSADLYFQSQDLRLEMMKVAPSLQKGLAEHITSLGKKSGDSWMELQKAARDKQQVSLQSELDAMYQKRLEAADGPARLMSTFKGWALLLQAFGVDTSSFVDECDKMIAKEYAKVPNKDINRLITDPSFTVDFQPAADMSQKGTQKGIQAAGELQKDVNKSLGTATDSVADALDNKSPKGQSEKTAVTTKKSVTVGGVTTAMEELLAESKLLTTNNSAAVKKDLGVALVAAAGSDGDAKTVSDKDKKAIEMNVAGVLERHHLDYKDANLLTKKAIERAQGRELNYN